MKSTGDGLLALFDDPGRAVECAKALRGEMQILGLATRAGVHAGQVEHQPDGDVTGIAVNLAARVEAVGGRGDICVSQTMRDLLLGSSVGLRSVGTKELKGIPTPVEVFLVTS